MSHPKLRHLASGRLGIASTVNHDLVINPVRLADPGTRQLTYHGGPTIQNPKLYLVQVGNWWGDIGHLEAFAKDLMESGYLAPLHELGYGTNQGKYNGLYKLPGFMTGSAKDSQIQSKLVTAIQQGDLPPNDENSLYAMLFPDGFQVVFDGDNSGSCDEWCGYHSNTATTPSVYYSVQTSTSCVSCRGANTPFDAFCMVLSHEVAEACTDPTGQGWWDNSDGSENADIEAWIALQYGPWTVQGYYTNERGNTIGTYAPVVNPEPGTFTKDDALTIVNKIRNNYVETYGPKSTTRRFAVMALDRVSNAINEWGK
jgi:hypothetical protein